MMGSVSVVVVNWNRRALLQECLESLARQTLPPRELIVVDNGSTDGSVELVRDRFPEAQLVALPRNTGFAAGNNCGLRQARGEYVALLNNDAVADPDWLSRLVQAIDAHPAVGCCASKMLLYHRRGVINSTGILYSTVGTAVDRGWMCHDGPRFDEPDYPIGACGGAALYRRSMLEEIGLFDEDFSPAYCEDVDLSLRAQLRGYRCLYVPSAVVYHRVGATLGHGSFRSVYLGARNQWYVWVKNIPAGLLVKHSPALVLYTVVQLGVHGLKGDLAPYVLGSVAACAKLPGMLRKRRQIQRRRTVTAQQLERMMVRRPLRAELLRLARGTVERLSRCGAQRAARTLEDHRAGT